MLFITAKSGKLTHRPDEPLVMMLLMFRRIVFGNVILEGITLTGFITPAMSEVLSDNITPSV
jgi:hypothetical protein